MNREREGAIEDLRHEATIEYPGEWVRIWACQGPPWCLLEADAAVAAEQGGGCPWCSIIWIWPDGTETRHDPPRPV